MISSLKLLNNKTKELRDKKNTLNEKITNYIEKNQSLNSSIKISDGQLKFIKVKETQPLTFKYLETCLSEIIKNEEQVTKIIEYIKNKRDIKYVHEIKRLYNN